MARGTNSRARGRRPASGHELLVLFAGGVDGDLPGVGQAALTKPVASHPFGHSFAKRLLTDSYAIRTVPELPAIATFARQ